MQVVGLGAAADLTLREGPRLRSHMAHMAQQLLAGVRAQLDPEDQASWTGGGRKSSHDGTGVGTNTA